MNFCGRPANSNPRNVKSTFHLVPVLHSRNKVPLTIFHSWLGRKRQAIKFNPFYATQIKIQSKTPNNQLVIRFFRIHKIGVLAYFPNIMIFFPFQPHWETDCIFWVYRPFPSPKWTLYTFTKSSSSARLTVARK